MVKFDENNRFPLCASCGLPIIHREKDGVYDDGHRVHHASCIQDKYGKDSLLDERGMKAKERQEVIEKLYRFVNFDRQPPNKYGARKVA